jgi:hypothetical protein
MAVVESHQLRLGNLLRAPGGSQICTGREDFAGGSTVLPMVSEGLELELSDLEAEDARLNGDNLWQVVEIVIGGFQLPLRFVL